MVCRRMNKTSGDIWPGRLYRQCPESHSILLHARDSFHLSRCPLHTSALNMDPWQGTFQPVTMPTPAFQQGGSFAMVNYLLPCAHHRHSLRPPSLFFFCHLAQAPRTVVPLGSLLPILQVLHLVTHFTSLPHRRPPIPNDKTCAIKVPMRLSPFPISLISLPRTPFQTSHSSQLEHPRLIGFTTTRLSRLTITICPAIMDH